MDPEQDSEQDMTHSAREHTGEVPVYDPIEALLAATERLTESVETLSTNVTVQAQQSRRLRRVAAAVIAVFVLVGGVGYYAVSESHDSQVVNCENANETRAANRVLWAYVLDLAAQGARPGSAENLTKIKAWVNVLYEDRDCSDLSRQYKQPDPPQLRQK